MCSYEVEDYAGGSVAAEMQASTEEPDEATTSSVLTTTHLVPIETYRYAVYSYPCILFR